MHSKHRMLIGGAAAGFLAAGSLAAALSGTAQASTPGCAFTNGCATLHGVDGGGSAVAMDAKYQSAKPGTLIIGYPDKPGDGATSFTGVVHFPQGHNVTTWDDTDLFPGSFPDRNPATSPIFITGFHEDVNTGALEFEVTGGTAPYTATLTGLDGAKVTSPIPASTTVNPFNGQVSVSGDTLAPGVYNNIVLTITDSATVPAANTVTYTGSARVTAHKVTTAVGNSPYYTFVQAKNGVWSNACVTNIGGSGALQLQTCTNGKDHYQDFYALNGAGVPQGDLLTNGAGSYHIQNLLATYGSPNSCLVDTSTVNPATPETNVFDTALGGRQLRVNGSCTSPATEWDWAV